jgi:GNAT superfamily N-acetyltransferase
VTFITSHLAPFEVTLRDGRRVTIRSVQPADADRFRAAFARLSAEARYSRFMASVSELSDAALARAVNPVHGREHALVAESEDAIVAAARYIVDAAGESCEFAVTVADDWQRMGVASRMLEALVGAATGAGLKSMYGYVLAANRPMLELARRLGFEVTSSEEGPTVRLVQRTLS